MHRLQNKFGRKHASEKSLARSKMFDWGIAAKDILNLIKEKSQIRDNFDFKSNILEVPKGSIIAGDWMGLHKGNAKLDSSQERFLTVMRYGKKINQSYIQSKSYYFL